MSVKQVIYLNTLLTDKQVDDICSQFVTPEPDNIENIIERISNIILLSNKHNDNQELIKSTINSLVKTSTSIKFTDLCCVVDGDDDIVPETFQDNNNTNYVSPISLKNIEDWKDPSKINLIKLLIVFGFFNNRYLIKTIGNQSKKTYENGEMITENSLALKKFFSDEIKVQMNNYYSNFDNFQLEFIGIGANKELVLSETLKLNKILQSELVCRKKFVLGEFDKYKKKICDIIDTRDKEERIFELFNKISFGKFVSTPSHSALKFLLYGTWETTKQNHRWLTELITYVNNNSDYSKKYLEDNLKINNSYFLLKDNKSKADLIKEVSKKLGLDNSYNKFVDFIFALGTYYKHGTYYKWYSKELDTINFFDTYKNKTWNEMSLEFQNNIFPNERSSEIISKLNEFHDFMDGFKNNMKYYLE